MTRTTTQALYTGAIIGFAASQFFSMAHGIDAEGLHPNGGIFYSDALTDGAYRPRSAAERTS